VANYDVITSARSAWPLRTTRTTPRTTPRALEKGDADAGERRRRTLEKGAEEEVKELKRMRSKVGQSRLGSSKDIPRPFRAPATTTGEGR